MADAIDGDAERLISVVLHTMAEEVDTVPRPLLRQDVVIISKAGYIQGTPPAPLPVMEATTHLC
jgi:hypothetical protein